MRTYVLVPSFRPQLQGSAQRAARRPSPLMDQRRSNQSLGERLEQAHDHVPGQ